MSHGKNNTKKGRTPSPANRWSVKDRRGVRGAFRWLWYQIGFESLRHHGAKLHHKKQHNMLQVRIYQKTNDGDTSIDSTTTIRFGSSNNSVKSAVGTICREIFHRMDLYKKMGSRYAKCTEPLLATFTTKGEVIDLGGFEDELTDRVKPSYSPKGRIAYATRFLALTQEALNAADRLNETVDFDDLIESLNAQA